MSSAPTRGPVQRPDLDRDLREIFQRLEDLERVRSGGTPFSGASVYKSAAQSMSDNTSTILSFNTEEYDEGGYHSTSSNNSRLTVPADGWYRFTINVRWAANGTGIRFAGLQVNGAGFYAGVTGLASTLGETDLGLSRDVRLVAGNYMEVITNQNSGGNLNVLSGAPTVFQVARLG